MRTPLLLDQVAQVIRARRTHKSFTGEPVDRAQIAELLDLARWAPNHRLSEPWRFTVIEHAAIPRLIAFLRSAPEIIAFPDPAKGAAKLAKLLERLPTAGALIQVTWMRQLETAIDFEDHAAAAAAVQNLLLAASAAGLGSYWSTSPALTHPLTLGWCGIDTDKQGFLGCIWLGHPADQPQAPTRRPLDERVRWIPA
ncbi:MAG TPA: nitroreductase family protein [Planctomycetota bacterium]|nr:nitroreductase family protein [Planctomycetota bacterium]